MLEYIASDTREEVCQGIVWVAAVVALENRLH